MALAGAVESLDHVGPTHEVLPQKYKYIRPLFLAINEDTIDLAKDKSLRIVLSSVNRPLPMNAGYAECINSGKSPLNEDMAYCTQSVLHSQLSSSRECAVPYAYFAIFDGHAGHGAALDAYKQLHHIIKQKLVDCLDDLVGTLGGEHIPAHIINRKELVKGCLETSFVEMDEVIKDSSGKFHYPGGCAVLVVLLIMGDCYLANAGDCRAMLCDKGICSAVLTRDFSPHHDRERIMRKAYENQHLMGDVYTCRTYFSTPSRTDLGKSILYKEPNMSGWAYKTLTVEDLKYPLIAGTGRKSRLMGTLGVVRGFGDHGLHVNNHTKLRIKPFLTCMPEITMLERRICSDSSVLVMGSDGLWDGINCIDAASLVHTVTSETRKSNHVLQSAASQLVHRARGNKLDTNNWQTREQQQASVDDITTFIIPLYPLINGYFDIAVHEQGKQLPPMRKQLFGEDFIFNYPPRGDANKGDSPEDEPAHRQRTCSTPVVEESKSHQASTSNFRIRGNYGTSDSTFDLMTQQSGRPSLIIRRRLAIDEDDELPPFLMTPDEDTDYSENARIFSSITIMGDDSSSSDSGSSNLRIPQPCNPEYRLLRKRKSGPEMEIRNEMLKYFEQATPPPLMSPSDFSLVQPKKEDYFKAPSTGLSESTSSIALCEEPYSDEPVPSTSGLSKNFLTGPVPTLHSFAYDRSRKRTAESDFCLATQTDLQKFEEGNVSYACVEPPPLDPSILQPILERKISFPSSASSVTSSTASSMDMCEDSEDFINMELNKQDDKNKDADEKD